MKNLGSYQDDKNVYEFYEEPIFLQSEYYNVYFQKALLDLGEAFELKNLLSTTAQEVAFAQFKRLFKKKNKFSVDDRKKVVEDYYANCGFGRLDLKPIQAKGGHVDVHSEHYATAWVRHFGHRSQKESGVSYFTLGFLCGIIEAIFETKPGVFDGKQLKCISKGDDCCRFEIFRGFKRKLNPSPAMGKVPIGSESGPSNETIQAITDIYPNGLDSENGLIEAFDTTYTRHYINYFALIEIKLLMQARKKLGTKGLKQIKNLISQTSEKNTYFTFGRLFNSDFWQEHLKKSGEASGSGKIANCLDVLSAFGHGSWSLVESSENEYRVKVPNCPRTNAALKLVGNTKAPIAFYNGGLVRGLANIAANGLDEESVDIAVVNSKAEQNTFDYSEESSRMTGGEEDILVARKS